MWHEARRMEKSVRHKMVDNVKRQERKKQFYETVRREPEEFMQLHGQKVPIYVDPAIAEAAESPNILRKWQGDPNILIDRFDVRVHLEQIDEPLRKQARKNMLKEDVVELQCEYERYRILVLNEFQKVSEASYLVQIAAKEFWPMQQSSFSAPSSSTAANYKGEQEKKRKLTGKRAAIAFNYADSETVKTKGNEGGGGGGRRQEEPSSSSDEDEPEEFDPVISLDELTAEEAAELNKVATRFCITSGAFLELQKLDRKERTSTAQIKEIDKAKLALSGRNAKADRAVLKRRRALVMGNLGSATHSSEQATTTLLSFLASSNKNELKEESSSSESGEEFVRTEFITSFGGEEERGSGRKRAGEEQQQQEEEESGVVHGPILPTKEYRRLLELSRRKSISPESKWNGRAGQRVRSSRSPARRSSRSPSPRRRGGGAGRRSSRSRSRERRRRRRRRSSTSSSSRSASPKRSRNDSRKGGGGRTSDRAKEEGRSRANGNGSGKRKKEEGQKQMSLAHPQQSRPMASSSLIGMDEQQSSSLISNDDESDSPLGLRSSMSESEKERVERENRKRRIRRTKRVVREQQQQQNSNGGPSVGDEGGGGRQRQQEAESPAEKAAKKLRLQMQKALTKTAAQLKEEEEQRQKEMQREKKQREDELFEESRLLRQRERQKRREEEERERRGRKKQQHNNDSGKEGSRSSRMRRRRSTSSSSSR